MKTLKRYFTREELDFLLQELLMLSKEGVGPVESGVPIDGYHSPDKVEFYTAKNILDEMKIGDSRVISNKVRLKQIIKAAKRIKVQIVVKRIDKGEFRIWKIDEPRKLEQ